MKEVRIGNDIAVAWSLERDGQPFELSGLRLSLYLKGVMGKVLIEDYSVSGNTIYWRFRGKDQRMTGIYSLVLVCNEAEDGMITTDVCDFVKLVECSCKAVGADGKGVHTETISLTSQVVTGVASVVDSVLSETSSNPVENRVVTAALAGKVDRQEGKGLSSNDYTDADKEKLAGLKNYDDTEVKQQIGLLEKKADSALEQVADVESELTELSDEVGKKADSDGTYLDFTAGRTIDMLGVHEGDDSEFLFRPTDGEGSIKDGKAVIERIEGNSVVWNQLLKNDDPSNTINGLAITNNGDGSWTANGTPSADVWLAIDQYPFASVVGHKYLLYGCPKGGNVGTYCLFEASGRLSVEEGNGSITSVNSSELRPYIVVRGGVVCNNLVFRPRVVNLTKMFGAGYEPLTLEEFYQRIPQGIDINAYNEGEIVDMRAEGIKSVGFNQWKAESSFDSANLGQNYTIYLKDKDAIESLKTIYTLLAEGHDVFFNAKTSGTVHGVNIGTMVLMYNNRVFDAMLFPNIVNEANRFKHLDKDAIKNAQGAILYATSLSSWSISDICFNLVHTGYRNGEYEPYVSEEIALPTMTYFPQGMRSIGKVCDEITQKQTIQRIAVREFQEGDLENPKVLTDGTKTYYELAEPIVTDIEPILLEYDAYDFGTEQVIASGKCAPLKASIVYGFNARDTIRNNRESIEELTRRITILEQMLGVMAAQASAVNFVE